jgi:predicted transcriptional regulator
MERNFDRPEVQRRNRTRLEIIASILTVAANGARKTHIMYQANLSFRQLEEYLNFLLEKNLLTISGEPHAPIYEITPQGIQYLKNFQELSRRLSGRETPT